MDRLASGKLIRMLTVIDESACECLAIRVDVHLSSEDVLDVLSVLFVLEGLLKHIRLDNGSEFTAHALRDWVCVLGVKTSYIAPCSPWGNRYNKRFNGKLRGELLRRESFYSLKEAEVLIESRLRNYGAYYTPLTILPDSPHQ